MFKPNLNIFLQYFLQAGDKNFMNLLVYLYFEGTGTSREVARAIMSTSLADEIQTLIINDTEMDARDSANKGSALYCKNYNDMVEFKWKDIVMELIGKQSFLAEVLLAVALPTGKVGNTQATESLVPVLGTIFGMLMKQRFQALSAVQKIVSVTLASEQTHQKVSLLSLNIIFLSVLFVQCLVICLLLFFQNIPVVSRT